MFNSPDDLQDKIDEYFKSGIKTKKVILKNGTETEIPCPTITGLCIFCGFESRQSFYAYEDKPEFSYTIKRARLFIENEYEQLLQAGNNVGAIFALKNFGWIDTKEIKHEINPSFLNIDPLDEAPEPKPNTP